MNTTTRSEQALVASLTQRGDRISQYDQLLRDFEGLFASAHALLKRVEGLPYTAECGRAAQALADAAIRIEDGKSAISYYCVPEEA